MSRHLPAHANLEHLRKQAKDLLSELQQQNPDAQLADAQHRVARDYGFASWPKLKTYVESLPRAGDPTRAPLTHSPFDGTWTANLSRSKPHPASAFQRATMRFLVNGDTVTIAHVVVDDSGHEQRAEQSIEIDGKERPSGGAGYVAIARWLSAHAFEVVRMKDHTIDTRATYEVSPDGSTLTISGAEQLIVCDRATDLTVA
jgi:hypothetical protein